MITSILSNRGEFKRIITEINNQFVDGKLYNFSFEEIKQAKTSKQLGFIFGGLAKALQSFYYEETGEKYPIETIKELLYDEIGIDEILYLPTGKKIVYKKSLSKMTKEEASNFINQVLIWIDENTNCVLPPGLRYCWTAHVTDKEIEDVMAYPMQERDEYYLTKVRKMNCVYCGKPNCVPHHIRTGFFGKAQKPPDYMAIPLCEECHVPIAHGKSEEYLINGLKNVLNGLKINVFCRLLYQRTYEHKN